MRNTLLGQMMVNEDKKRKEAQERHEERVQIDREQELYRSYHEQMRASARGRSSQSSPNKSVMNLKECHLSLIHI